MTKLRVFLNLLNFFKKRKEYKESLIFRSFAMFAQTKASLREGGGHVII